MALKRCQKHKMRQQRCFSCHAFVERHRESNDRSEGFSGSRCHAVQIPDVMGIRPCLNGTLNLCGLTKHERKVASKALGKCLVSSLTTKNFFSVLLGLLRAGLRLALRLAFPGSTSVMYPFWVRVKSFFRRKKQPEPSVIIFTSRPCNDTVPVIFPDFLGIADCILKKLPFFNILRLLREVVCNLLTIVVNFFRHSKRLSFMAPLTELVQIILQLSKVVVPVLKALLPKPCNEKELQRGTCDRQLLPQNPCNGTISVTFNDPLDIRECIDIAKLWCFEEYADKDEMLIELMRDIVCVMKKLPALKVRLMLKKLLCRGIAWLIEFLRSRDLKTMRKVVEAFHTLGSCYKYYPTNPKAERRLLADADFYLPGTRRKLLH
ncbi:hypothetical protein HPB50_026938 [Hyalomma asiaticum]|uniref:Uncharacterized protein n=1 Tax=Hyalomma asiaticum TaxID=266040 RepID=A0ACB7TEE9_HYAAI|nr:hypothetical protein HPB50_026938 [Hyalomma asiaticum]